MDETVVVNPVGIAVGLAISALWIYCAIRTAMNGRWGLFVLGFFCGIAWIIGAFSGSDGGGGAGGSVRDYRKMKRQRIAPSTAMPAPRDDGRCPACGKHTGQTSGRCPTCGYFFGA